MRETGERGAASNNPPPDGNGEDGNRAVAKPQGYRPKAMVINVPGGIPGNIGFFLNWVRPTV